jgi:hypothetical protein
MLLKLVKTFKISYIQVSQTKGRYSSGRGVFLQNVFYFYGNFWVYFWHKCDTNRGPQKYSFLNIFVCQDQLAKEFSKNVEKMGFKTKTTTGGRLSRSCMYQNGPEENVVKFQFLLGL